MKKVFLDIGAHTGESLQEVIKPIYGFDRIIAFEPSSACWSVLQNLQDSDSRIELCRFGLADGRQELLLYGSGKDSASTLDSEFNVGTDSTSETVLLEDASVWAKMHLDPKDLIVAKLNCEGGEVDILRSWIRSDIIGIFYNIMITFDIRNFKSLRYQEGELRAQLRRLCLSNTCFADDVMLGPSHGERLSHWLTLFGLDQPPLPSLASYRTLYSSALSCYSLKRGYRQRLELLLKEKFNYAALPAPAKVFLQRTKALFGLSVERN